MKFLIMTNGDYGSLDWYRGQKERFDRVIGVDGGASQAIRLDIVPHWVIGDLDSLNQADRDALEKLGAVFYIYPAEKDYTDTQLALELAQKEGAGEIVIWGGTGDRLDHTFSNLFSAARLAEQGIAIRFEHPRITIYLVRDRLVLPGQAGDTVSLIVLGDRAEGVTLQGFRYPLHNAVLDGHWPCTLSNVIAGPNPSIQVASGVLAVFHHLLPVT
ncbi:MAG: thiamine diphosphokinase [Thermacetogeniaceae bacterium]